MLKTLFDTFRLLILPRRPIGHSGIRLFIPPIRTAGLVFAISLCLSVAAATGQDTVTGAFQGDVSNNRTTDPVPGAVVQITNVQTGVVYRLTTDSKGRFYQGLLAPGFYDISVASPTFKPRLLRREIKVSLTGDIVPVPVSLEPETTPATPTAPPTVAEQPDDIRVNINTSDARRDGSKKYDEITVLPVGGSTVTRSFDEFATLLPGVAPPPQTIGDVAGPGVGPGVGSAGQFAVNGLRSRANNFTVDGSDNNDEDIGVRRQGFVAFIPQPIESIQEFNIITLLAPAQFGRNIGAQVNAVSRRGGNKVNGSAYGFFNSNQLNARNFFDTKLGNAVSPLRTTSGQSVLLDGAPIMVRNQSGGENSFTFGDAGGTLGGAIRQNRLFYFLSGEYQKINASQEKSFAVPTLEQRGPFRTGASGITTNFFTGATFAAPLFPAGPTGNAVFSLFPFANNPGGIYGENTFTQILPASGRGVILSGRLDNNFALGSRQQSITARYNFTDDKKEIPAVGEAIFATVLSKIRTHNLSLFLNSELNGSSSSSRLFNQVRFSIGRSGLNFDEVRNTDFLIPSDALPNTPFLLNARAMFNVSLPNSPARFVRVQPGSATLPESTENVNGLLGQVMIAGFSPLGVDVFNFPQDRINKTYQLADELTWRTGSHAFVFGADFRRTDLNSNLPRLARTLITFNGTPRLVPRIGTCANGGVGDFCFLPTSDPRSVIRAEDIAALGVASNTLLTLNVDRPDSRINLRYHQLNFYGQDTWRVRPELSLSFGLRYEYNTPVKERDGLIEQTFSDQRLDLVPVLKKLINGRTTLYKPDRNNFGPRVGLAWSPQLFGNRRVSVFRVGYGLFYDQILGAVANQSRNVFPTFLTVNLAGILTPRAATQISNPAQIQIGPQIPLRRPGTLNEYNSAALRAGGVPFDEVLFLLAGGFFPNAINVTLPAEKLETPMAHHYSFTYEQQLNQNFTLSVGYAGTTGRHLLRFTTPNLGSSLTVVPIDLVNLYSSVPFGQVQTYNPSRPLDQLNPDGSVDSLGAVNQFETTAPSTYNSLQTQLRGRFLDSLNMQFSYTFSKVTDEVSDVFDLAGASVLPQNSFDLKAERGPANFDVRHRWAYDLIYNFRKNEGRGFARHLTDNLQIATTGRFHSGQPFTVNSVIDVNLDGNLTDRLNTLTGIEVTGDRRQPLRLTTPNTGSLLAPFGQNGQIGRNSFRAGNVLELDVSVIKQFAIGSNRLGLRTDIFNVINRSNFGVPIRLLEAPGFGKAASTVTPGRRVQFSLKYEF